MFSGGGCHMQVTTGWNTTTKLPTGTQFLDFMSNATNTTNNHYIVSTFSTTANASIIRFTSQANSTHSWFSFAQTGSFRTLFTIGQPTHGVASWLDLNKTMFSHFIRFYVGTSSLSAYVSLVNSGVVIRSCVYGSALKNITGPSSFNYLSYPVAVYNGIGRGLNSLSTNVSGFTTNQSVSSFSDLGGPEFQLPLPIYEASVNPAFSSDVNPVHTCLPTSFYMTNSNMPSDLGIIFHYANNTMIAGDRFIVSAGVEEWEILRVANNSTALTGASAAIVARVV
jgi:hypothetical protein